MIEYVTYKRKKYPFCRTLNKLLALRLRHDLTPAQWLTVMTLGDLPMPDAVIKGYPDIKIHLAWYDKKLYFSYPQGWERELRRKKEDVRGA